MTLWALQAHLWLYEIYCYGDVITLTFVLTPPVEPNLQTDILKRTAQILLLSQIKVPRHVCFNESAQYSIHVQCD